jgi:hypothetical protein
VLPRCNPLQPIVGGQAVERPPTCTTALAVMRRQCPLLSVMPADGPWAPGAFERRTRRSSINDDAAGGHPVPEAEPVRHRVCFLKRVMSYTFVAAISSSLTTIEDLMEIASHFTLFGLAAATRCANIGEWNGPLRRLCANCSHGLNEATNRASTT